MANYKKSETTKKILIDEAARLFYNRGYRDVTIREISNTLGLSVSRINYHFESKSNLAYIIADDFFREFISKVKKALSVDGRTVASPTGELVCVNLLIKTIFTNAACRRFLRDISDEGIFAKIWVEISLQALKEANKVYEYGAGNDILLSYAIIYAYSLDGMVGSMPYEEIHFKKSVSYYTSLYERLFMKLLDRPGDSQDRGVAGLEQLASEVIIEVNDFTHIDVYRKL